MAIVGLVTQLLALSALLGLPMLLFRWMSGWGDLERRYMCPRRQRPDISRGSYQWIGARFGWAQVGLVAEVSNEGLWFRATFPLTIVCDPILLPWSAICLRELRSVWVIRRVELNVDEYSKTIRISGFPGDRLIEKLMQVNSEAKPNNAMQATCEDARA